MLTSTREIWLISKISSILEELLVHNKELLNDFCQTKGGTLPYSLLKHHQYSKLFIKPQISSILDLKLKGSSLDQKSHKRNCN